MDDYNYGMDFRCTLNVPEAQYCSHCSKTIDVRLRVYKFTVRSECPCHNSIARTLEGSRLFLSLDSRVGAAYQYTAEEVYW